MFVKALFTIAALWFLFVFNTAAEPKPFKDKQLAPGSLVLPKHPDDVQKYIDQNEQIALGAVRASCNLLTNDDLKELQGVPLGKRPKALKRRIKQICESLEEVCWEQRVAKGEDYSLVYELELYAASYIAEARETAKGVTLFDKMKMGLHTFLSRFQFSYAKQVKPGKEAADLKVSAHMNDPIALSEIDPVESPFWHAPVPGISPDLRFKHLEKLKKVPRHEHPVLVFDELSLDGSGAKIKAADLKAGDGWSLKWGDEVHTDVAASRLFAALGFDVDQAYFYGPNRLTLVFPKTGQVTDFSAMAKGVFSVSKIDIRRFVSEQGVVSDDMVAAVPDLKAFVGFPYARFRKCMAEARPDSVKRLGSMVPNSIGNVQRRPLRGSLLAHHWIGNWDIREQNTLITNVHMGDYKYRVSGVFSDLGTSFGVHINPVPPDFKVGLVNAYPWDLMRLEKWAGQDKVKVMNIVNSRVKFFVSATYADMRWMARQIAAIDKVTLRSAVDEAGWPAPIRELYFHKLAARRAQILEFFEVRDPHPIVFDRDLTIKDDGGGGPAVEHGQLLREIDPENNPEGFLHNFGRLRNYGGGR